MHAKFYASKLGQCPPFFFLSADEGGNRGRFVDLIVSRRYQRDRNFVRKAESPRDVLYGSGRCFIVKTTSGRLVTDKWKFCLEKDGFDEAELEQWIQVIHDSVTVFA